MSNIEHRVVIKLFTQEGQHTTENSKVLNYPTYSPDIAPSDFHSFLNLKKFMRGEKFQSNDVAISLVETYLSGASSDFFSQDIHSLSDR
jgi:[histone H3]-lysine36 N-dimethyltransferase SETMAR